MTERKSEPQPDNMVDKLWDEKEDKKTSRESAALSQLQETLEKERDKRQEERFLLICAVLVIYDVDAFGDMAGWSGPIVLGILELLFLIVAGRFYGIDEIHTFLMKMMEKVGQIHKNK